MRLIDASAWVHFLRRKGDPLVKRRVAELLQRGEAAHTCPTWFEILSGAKAEEEADVREAFSLSQRVLFEKNHWEEAALLERGIRARGLVVPRNDLWVATIAIAENLTLVCRDAHFDLIAKAVPRKFSVEQL